MSARRHNCAEMGKVKKQVSLFFKSVKKKETEKENHLWLIVLSDIMTNLMLFFLMLYVFTLQGAEAKRSFAAGLNNEAIDEKEKKAKELIQELKEKDIAKTISQLDNAEVQITSKEIRINVESPILFKSGSADLGNHAANILDVMGKLLNKLNNEIIVEGHTDNVPIHNPEFQDNWELSIARALSVIRHIRERQQFDPKRLRPVGCGEFHPVASNDTEEGKALNRRVEIYIEMSK